MTLTPDQRQLLDAMTGWMHSFTADERDALRAALADADRLAEMGTQTTWQPIATAPKDGTKILVHRIGWHAPEIAQWSSYSHAWVLFEGSVEPTHWMPLPNPPAGETT